MSDAEEAAKALIGQGISAYVQARYPDHDGTYVEGWAITAEWTSVALEQSNSGGVITVKPTGQSLSMSRGLVEFGTDTENLYVGTEAE